MLRFCRNIYDDLGMCSLISRNEGVETGEKTRAFFIKPSSGEALTMR